MQHRWAPELICSGQANLAIDRCGDIAAGADAQLDKERHTGTVLCMLKAHMFDLSKACGYSQLLTFDFDMCRLRLQSVQKTIANLHIVVH